MILSAMRVLEELLEKAHEANTNLINSCDYDLDVARIEDELQTVVDYLAEPKRIGKKKLESYVRFLNELKEDEYTQSRIEAINMCQLEVIETYYKFTRE